MRLGGLRKKGGSGPAGSSDTRPYNRHILSHYSGCRLTAERDIMWLPPASDWLFYLVCQRSCLLPSLINTWKVTKYKNSVNTVILCCCVVKYTLKLWHCSCLKKDLKKKSIDSVCANRRLYGLATICCALGFFSSTKSLIAVLPSCFLDF